MTPRDINPISKPDFMPVGELRALQLAKLQKLIPYEYERVPLFRRRCDEKGVKPRDLVTLRDLAKFPFMKKTDLRDEYPYGLTAAPLRDINRFHCSSGTTGKPICIPQTKGDLEVWTDATARCFAMYGITQDDIVQVSYGYGLFTGGLGAHQGAERLGCAVLPTGAGNTEKQIMLMKDLGVTVICCTPSYFLHLATVAEKLGVDFRRDTKLKHGVFGAEPWTDEIRARIEQISGIAAHDIYGLTEIAGPGVAGNCPHCHGSTSGRITSTPRSSTPTRWRSCPTARRASSSSRRSTASARRWSATARATSRASSSARARAGARCASWTASTPVRTTCSSSTASTSSRARSRPAS